MAGSGVPPRLPWTNVFEPLLTPSPPPPTALLQDPEYISVHAEAAAPTPLKLQQAYMECELPQKLDILWSFIKAHLKAKTIIFASTCKQVQQALCSSLGAPHACCLRANPVRQSLLWHVA